MTDKTKKIVRRSAFATIVAGALVVVFLTFKSNVKEEDAESYVSPYFTINDMFRSTTASRYGIDNTTSDKDILLNMKALFMKVLDPIRKKYGKPITISSGYRCKQVNDLVGGVATSQHMKGEAADIDCGSKEENRKIFNLIKESGVFDQLINESDFDWVHVSYKRIGYNRNQVLSL